MDMLLVMFVTSPSIVTYHCHVCHFSSGNGPYLPLAPSPLNVPYFYHFVIRQCVAYVLTRRTDHDLGHEDPNLLLRYVVQDLCSTGPSHETCLRSCR